MDHFNHFEAISAATQAERAARADIQAEALNNRPEYLFITH